MKPFRLGETVTVNRRLWRGHETRQVDRLGTGRFVTQHWRVWKPGAIDTVVGIVVGTRTLMNVHREYIGYEEGYDNDLTTAERFQAVWVATDLRTKPFFVLPEDAHRIED